MSEAFSKMCSNITYRRVSWELSQQRSCVTPWKHHIYLAFLINKYFKKNCLLTVYWIWSENFETSSESLISYFWWETSWNWAWGVFGEMTFTRTWQMKSSLNSSSFIHRLYPLTYPFQKSSWSFPKTFCRKLVKLAIFNFFFGYIAIKGLQGIRWLPHSLWLSIGGALHSNATSSIDHHSIISHLHLTLCFI